ncbi:hypothetical protein N7530_012565 [Penicillium desertorum]|uniref:JmjC domain-containing protein n=1 Tax=Penicillium desertorum TaxID=1303715 RepID=A0A9W9WFK6_9EURO|nr:hypothetical protein N7530_012565 [Penicillium desertorum]
MDHAARDLSSDTEYSSEAFIATLLRGKPEHKHLDVLTELLTRSSEIDERVASSISAAWHWLCQNDLWSTRYESLSEYRNAIGYTETVRPIVQRHKKSELAKRSSIQTIFRYWKIPYDKALPINTRPLTWSKHLLSLIACLSKHRGHLESVSLLEECMKNRPERGRTRNRLMASDVQRALDTLGIPQTRLATRESKKSRLSSRAAQSKGTDSGAEVGSTPTTIHPEALSLPDTPLSLGFSPTQELQTSKEPDEWQCCGCIPICLPLIALISTPEAKFDKKLLTALVDWAYTMSWGSFCSDHLMRLAQFIPGEDPCYRNRTEAIQNLEAFCSRGCYSSIGDQPSTSAPNLSSNTELLCRYTGSTEAWWRWQRDGFLHIPGFFSYMEEFGVFERVRKYLNSSATQEYTNSIDRNTISRCYRMLSEMVQRDPAYYAVLVACRPDQNSKLIYRPAEYRQHTVSETEDIGFGVPIDRIKALVQGEGTSDIQSTVVFPTYETAEKIRLVPGFHRQLNSWLQSSLELKYGNRYKVFDEAQEIVVQPGDLVMCLPQILRWPKTFSSSGILNLSQVGLENSFTTTPEGPSERYNTYCSNAGEQPGPQFYDTEQAAHYYHAAKAGLTEDSWCDVSSAIGQALAGHLDWSNGRVSEEMNCILGSPGATAVEFVAKSRAQLARQFHKLCDSLERDAELDYGMKNPSRFTTLLTGLDPSLLARHV